MGIGIEFYAHENPKNEKKMAKKGPFSKKFILAVCCFAPVYLASRAKIELFTHPIFESDFDCLTGKYRLHALSLLSPIASDKNKNFKKKIYFWSFFVWPKMF